MKINVKPMLLLQCAEFYGAGMPDYDEKAKETVNAILDKIDVPFFNPCWREEAEADALKTDGVDLYDAELVESEKEMANLEKVFGVKFAPNHDWCTTGSAPRRLRSCSRRRCS